MTPTLRTSILRVVASAFPALAYGYPRTYTVAAVRADSRLDLTPPPDARHLAELAAVAPYTIAGVAISPAVGAEVLVAFADADPRRPRVLGFAPGTPTAAGVDASGTVRVGASSLLVSIGNGSESVSNPVGAVGRVVRYGDTMVFPVGPAATPTALTVLADVPLVLSVSVAKVSA